MMGCPPKLFTYLFAIYIFHTLEFKVQAISWSHITLHKRLTFDRSFILAWKNWKTKRRRCIIHLFVLYWVQQNCRYHHTIAVYVKSWLVWPLARPFDNNMNYWLCNVIMDKTDFCLFSWLENQLKSAWFLTKIEKKIGPLQKKFQDASLGWPSASITPLYFRKFPF